MISQVHSFGFRQIQFKVVNSEFSAQKGTSFVRWHCRYRIQVPGCRSRYARTTPHRRQQLIWDLDNVDRGEHSSPITSLKSCASIKLSIRGRKLWQEDFRYPHVHLVCRRRLKDCWAARWGRWRKANHSTHLVRLALNKSGMHHWPHQSTSFCRFRDQWTIANPFGLVAMLGPLWTTGLDFQTTEWEQANCAYRCSHLGQKMATYECWWSQ